MEWSSLVMAPTQTKPDDAATTADPTQGTPASPVPDPGDEGLTIVGTVDTVRLNFFLNLYTLHHVPLLIVGPTGRLNIHNSFTILVLSLSSLLKHFHFLYPILYESQSL